MDVGDYEPGRIDESRLNPSERCTGSCCSGPARKAEEAA